MVYHTHKNKTYLLNLTFDVLVWFNIYHIVALRLVVLMACPFILFSWWFGDIEVVQQCIGPCKRWFVWLVFTSFSLCGLVIQWWFNSLFIWEECVYGTIVCPSSYGPTLSNYFQELRLIKLGILFSKILFIWINWIYATITFTLWKNAIIKTELGYMPLQLLHTSIYAIVVI
jgi:hypothetical protein